ncbi:hypothetical protein, partial [Methanobacterium sp.]|uniref:hypothetical protein n=1 Tax=Methanobacterium sp. TaxID=2164 RepID=UPI003C73B627
CQSSNRTKLFRKYLVLFLPLSIFIYFDIGSVINIVSGQEEIEDSRRSLKIKKNQGFYKAEI